MIEQLQRTNVMESVVVPDIRLPPLHIPPSLEPVAYSMPNDGRMHTLYDFMTGIGEEHRFEEVWSDVENYNPLHASHAPRQGYTKEQRVWVKYKRDEGRNQAPFPHIETKQELRKVGLGTKGLIESLSNLELHHIFPQSYLQAYLGLANYPELINHAHNGITLSKMSHTGPYLPGVNESRHPDINEATRRYGEIPELIKKTLQNHWELAREGIKFWVFADDDKMFEIATKRTNRMREATRR